MSRSNAFKSRPNLWPNRIGSHNKQSGKKIASIGGKRRKKSVKRNVDGVRSKKIVSVSGNSKRRIHTNNLCIIYTHFRSTCPPCTPSSGRFFLLFLSLILNISSTLPLRCQISKARHSVLRPLLRCQRLVLFLSLGNPVR